jgi:FtsH-binding integral membrane protein
MGLMVTAVVAVIVVSSPFLLGLIFSNSIVFWGLLILELLLVLAVSRVAMSVSSGAGLALFFVYAAVNGLTLSVIFLVYDLGTITLAFITTAVTFGVMSVIGFTTKQDLTKWGAILFMGLIGLIIASVVNMFLASSALDWIITYAGILIFMGLTVYDTKRIKTMTFALAAQGETDVIGRVGVMGALRLYLDFINLFLYILRLLGRRRR